MKCPTYFRKIQSALRTNGIAFTSFSLPEDRTLKVVIRGIPTDIAEDEITAELELRGFTVHTVKRFGANSRPLPMCLVILAKTTQSTTIYEITSMFYLSVRVESFKKSGPAQCFLCQRFGQGSKNCGQAPRCVKCSGNHLAKECTKPKQDSPSCCNCGGSHTANFLGCPYYLHLAASSKPAVTIPPPPSQSTSASFAQPKSDTSYADAVKSDKNPISNETKTNQINIDEIITLLTDLLTALTSDSDHKSIMVSTIKSFLSLLTSRNG
ncbi:unnamed protein product [Macrosiphum euphorbiae]|uniref:Pre-C2HC domain-containing protein n=1 Tax=Macrosiphum euphorbiae TaxID=13131 RepID=A0AAV0X8W3_9HEMI|nr:unnamed protein product [Macrosiphum euphorbiae]